MPRKASKDDMDMGLRSWGGSSIGSTQLLLGRIAAAALSLGFLSLLVYTIATDGSPFRAGILTPWMTTTVIDYYVTALPFYVWVYAREAVSARHDDDTARSLFQCTPRVVQKALIALAWVVAFFCGGSVTVWLYVWLALMRVRAGDPWSKFFAGSM